jgi:hypothetical protein
MRRPQIALSQIRSPEVRFRQIRSLKIRPPHTRIRKRGMIPAGVTQIHLIHPWTVRLTRRRIVRLRSRRHRRDVFLRDVRVRPESHRLKSGGCPPPWVPKPHLGTNRLIRRQTSDYPQREEEQPKPG